jgi:hypothetical protein
MIAGMTIAFAVGTLAMSAWGGRVARSLEGVLTQALFMGGVLLVFQVVHVWIDARRNDRREAELRSTQVQRHPLQAYDEVAVALFELERKRPLIPWWRPGRWTWDDLQERLHRCSAPVPRTVAESLRLESLNLIELPNSMLEPEPITTGAPLSTGCLMLVMAVTLFGALLMLLGGSWLIGLLAIIGLLFWISVIPTVRWRLPWTAEHPRSSVAGLGVVCNARGQRWTVDNAMMILMARSETSSISVHIIGPPGWLSLTFANETDPEFIKLWQRWNHPHPRPELLD